VDRPGVLGPPWTDASADCGHGGVLTGPRPPAAPVRQTSPTGDDGEGSVVSALGERTARAQREGNVSGERCGEARGGCSPFIGAGERRGGVAGMEIVNGFNTIEDCRLDERLRRGIKGGEMKARW
jgi:hypothetical protein